MTTRTTGTLPNTLGYFPVSTLLSQELSSPDSAKTINLGRLLPRSTSGIPAALHVFKDDKLCTVKDKSAISKLKYIFVFRIPFSGKLNPKKEILGWNSEYL